MPRLIRAELMKMKRFHAVASATLMMLLSVLVTLFSATALDGTVWTYAFLVEQVIKNNALGVFPMCVTLIAGYAVARERTDGTLKNLLTVPVSYPALLCGKLAACAALSLWLGAASAAFTAAAELLTGYPGFTAAAFMRSLADIAANAFFLYLATVPVIAAAARFSGGPLIGVIAAFAYGYGGLFAAGNMALANVYPITASLGMIAYRAYDPAVHWNTLACAASLTVCVALAALLVATAKAEEPSRAAPKASRAPAKKGW